MKIKIGDIVRIVFLDHSEGHEAQTFEVFGRVYAKDRKTITVVCWGYAEAYQLDDNAHSYTIVRSTISVLEKLKATK